MASAITVARIRPNEGALLRRLRLAALDDSPEAFGQQLEDASARSDGEWESTARASSSGVRRAWFIARNDGREVGLVQGRRRPPHDCLVFSMWVAPSARRAGVGRAMLDAIDDWAAGWGARKVVLWVIAGNDGALRFYRRLGFQAIQNGPDAASGAAYGALALARPIRQRSVGADGADEIG